MTIMNIGKLHFVFKFDIHPTHVQSNSKTDKLVFWRSVDNVTRALYLPYVRRGGQSVISHLRGSNEELTALHGWRSVTVEWLEELEVRLYTKITNIIWLILGC